MKRAGSLISGIYLILSDRELPESETYSILISATMRTEDFRSPTSRKEAQSCLEDLATSLGSCGGIEVEDSKLVSESEFSIQDLRQWRRWDWDDISLSEEPPGEMTPPD